MILNSRQMRTITSPGRMGSPSLPIWTGVARDKERGLHATIYTFYKNEFTRLLRIFVL